MLLALNLTAAQEASLRAAAKAEGVEPPDLVQQLVFEHFKAPDLPAQTSTLSLDAKARAALAMLQSWIAEGQEASPEEIQRAEEEVEELKRNLNANRVATGERPVFR